MEEMKGRIEREKTLTGGKKGHENLKGGKNSLLICALASQSLLTGHCKAARAIPVIIGDGPCCSKTHLLVASLWTAGVPHNAVQSRRAVCPGY